MLTDTVINTNLFDSSNDNAIKSFEIDKEGAAATGTTKDFGVAVTTSSELYSSNAALTNATDLTDPIALATGNTDSYVDGDAAYTGYLNLGTYADGTNEVYLDVQADKGDKITVVAVAQGVTTIKYALLNAEGEIPSGTIPSETVGEASATEKAAYVFDFTADDADATNGGIYRIYSEDGDLEIARVYRDSDVETPNPGTATKKTYTFDANTLKAAGYNIGATFPSGALLGTDLYFKVMAKTIDNPITTETNNPTITGTVPFVTKSNTDLVEISRLGSSGIEFNVKGTANATIIVASTGSNNYSQYALIDGSDAVVSTGITSTLNSIPTGETTLNKVGIQDGIIKVQTTEEKTITYTGLTAGKYTLVSPYVEGATNDTNTRGGRVISIVVEDTAVHSERGVFSNVAAPEVISAVQKEGTSDVEVEVNAAVGYDGGDKVTVTITNNSNEVADTAISTVEGNTHKLSLSLKDKASGAYTVKAVLSRGTDNKEGSVTKTINFKLPLLAPTLRFTNNSTKAGGVDATLSWAAVQEATGYSVTVTEALEEGDTTSTPVQVYNDTLNSADANTDGSFSVNFGGTNGVTGLELNKTYIFSVTSLRADPSAEEGATPESSKPATTTKLVSATDDDEGGDPVTYTFDATKLPATLSDGDGKPITKSIAEYFDGYFSLSGEVNQRINSSSATTSVEVVYNKESAIVFTTKRLSNVSVGFSSTGGSNTSNISLKNENDEDMLTSAGEVAPTVTGTAGNMKTVTYERLPKGTYKLYTKPDEPYNRNTRVYTITVTEGVSTDRKDWGTVADPVITNVELSEDGESLDISVTADISDDGGDKLTVNMYDAEGNIAASKDTDSKVKEHTITIKPTQTGHYTFKAELVRNGVEAKHESAQYPATADLYFLLPLKTPAIRSVTDKGIDSETNLPIVEFAWDAVTEATSYLVKVTEQGASDTTTEEQSYIYDAETTTVMLSEGLEVGKTYIFSVAARRAETGENGADEDTDYAESEPHEITGKEKVSWAFAVYGPSSDKKTNNYSDADKTNSYNGTEKPINKDAGDEVRVWSLGGSGKIQPTSIDGLAFYYTTVNPATTNFVLSATAYVNEWTYSNGQDGFGVMAADQVKTEAENQDIWNNSYQAVASKVIYRWDAENNVAAYDDDLEKSRYEMQIGIGSTEKKGVTAENLSEFAANSSAAQNKYFKANSKSLETSLGEAGLIAGTYNIIGNYTGNAPKGTQEKYLLTQMRLTVELNNTGYFVSYTPVDKQTGEPIENKKYTIKYYDRDALSQIDKNNVYVGLFASRNADVSFRDISFTTSDPATDAPPEEQPNTTVIPSYGITSGSTVNHSEYEMLFAANWPGWLTIKDGKGDVIVDNDKIIPDEQGTINTYKVKDPVMMNVGVNTFQWTYTPDEAYNPEDPASYYKQNMGIEDGSTGESEEITQYTFLSDYSAQTDSFTVTYKAYGEEGDALYVSPTGSALGTGTKANPLDIYTAVKYAQPGQTIYLLKGKDGVYNLARTVTIDRGINGTVDADGNIKYIKMMPAPDAGGTRSIVLDFGRSCEGIVLAGDYWYLYGFDVTKSAYGSDGMRVCGSHNVVDSVYTYNNGNTGIQISRYRSLDRNFWPSYNTILNCTSYLNADQGFEDADGFAAKLTIGEGNVFDGCISAYNADDGWDLYAKTDTGSIGSVVIKNSIAYKNGYVLIKDTNGDDKISHAEATSLSRVLSLDGIETPAGNGNGFKMGGSSVPSTGNGHQLISSIAFRNRAKGIDSNSGPNLKSKNSISFNNESYNVAFYTSSAPETDFAAEGVISFRTADLYDVWGTPDGINPEIIKQTPYTEAAGERMIFKGVQETNESAVKNETNYYWDLEKKQSLNSKGETVDSNWFVSVDYKAFEAKMKKDIVGYPRNEDGSINMHDFLVLADESKRNDYFGGTTSPDQYEEIAPPTSGDVSSGDATGETESGVRPEDMSKYTELLTQNSTGARLGLWFNVVDAENVYYTGRAVKPVVHVYEGTTLLTKKDYSITYRNNIKACVVDKDYAHYSDYTSVPDNKKPSIIVRGKGNYIGLASTQYYSIRPVELSDDLYVAAKDIAVSSTAGKAQKINPVVTFNGKKLSKKDFEFGVEVQTTEEKPKVDADGNPVLGEDGQQETETVTGTRVDKTKTTASEDCKVVISAVAGGNFAGSTTINFRVISDKSKLASSFKVDKIPEQERLGYEDYEETKPIRVEPELVVKNKQNTPLTLAKVNEETGELEGDYTVTYRNNVEVGMATAIITGVNDYAGTKEVKFRIVAPRINTLMTGRNQSLKIYATETVAGESVTNPSKELDFKNLSYDYTGSAIRIKGLGVSKKTTVTTVDPETNETKTSEQWVPLEVDKDYTITYKNNNKAGRASVIIKGKGNYTGAITKTFKINVLDLNKPGNNVIGGTFADDYELKADFEKGSAKPEVILLVNGNKMQKGKDYTVTYRYSASVSSNNPNKKPTVVLRGRGGLKGTLTKTFTITKKSLSDADVTITADDVRISKRASTGYTGNLASRIIIKDANGRPLTAGVDYDKDSIEYELISGNGSISGKGTVNSNGTVDTSKQKPTATINSDSDVLTIRATVKAFDSSNAKKYARCNYSDSISVTYRVGYARTSIMSARVVVNYNNGRLKYFNYTGEQIRLNQSGVTTDLTVTVNGQQLKYNEDFEIVTKPVDSYVNNIKKGTASLTIRGIGKYTGTKVVRFKIGAKPFEWWTIPTQSGDSNGGSGSSSSQPAMLNKDLELNVL